MDFTAFKSVRSHKKEMHEGLEAARVAGAMAAEELGKYIEEGPAGISVLCFLGGLATTIIGILGLLNFGYGLTSPFAYVLNAYLVAFGIVTFLLEADVESMRKLKFIGRFSPWVEGYQMEVFNRANFLTELRGRGFFYLFIGTLAVTQCFVCLTFVAGLWNMLMGILCLLMSFGINPASHLQGLVKGRIIVDNSGGFSPDNSEFVEAVSAAAKSIGLALDQAGAKQRTALGQGASRAANAVEAPEAAWHDMPPRSAGSAHCGSPTRDLSVETFWDIAVELEDSNTPHEAMAAMREIGKTFRVQT
ncbi:unnamed protein product [Symbiodinium sp. KB8]|nr:unnamed protein product [Symbiodinium sp. KB8]